MDREARAERGGITVSDHDLRRRDGQRDRRQDVDPKYRDPATGRTWSGRGREPDWIKGRSRTNFEAPRPVDPRQVGLVFDAPPEPAREPESRPEVMRSSYTWYGWPVYGPGIVGSK